MCREVHPLPVGWVVLFLGLLHVAAVLAVWLPLHSAKWMFDREQRRARKRCRAAFARWASARAMLVRPTQDGLVALGSPVSVTFREGEGVPSLSAVVLGTTRRRFLFARADWEAVIDDVMERLVWEARHELRAARPRPSIYR